MGLPSHRTKTLENISKKFRNPKSTFSNGFKVQYQPRSSCIATQNLVAGSTSLVMMELGVRVPHRFRKSCGYIHSSSKFSGTSPNVFKMVASP
jgi:hypothetical protein